MVSWLNACISETLDISETQFPYLWFVKDTGRSLVIVQEQHVPSSNNCSPEREPREGGASPLFPAMLEIDVVNCGSSDSISSAECWLQSFSESRTTCNIHLMLESTGAHAVTLTGCQPPKMNRELAQAILPGQDMFSTHRGASRKGLGDSHLIQQRTSHLGQSQGSTVSC